MGTCVFFLDSGLHPGWLGKPDEDDKTDDGISNSESTDSDEGAHKTDGNDGADSDATEIIVEDLGDENTLEFREKKVSEE